VDHAAPVAGNFNQPGEAELGQVLAGEVAPGDLCQRGHVEVLIPQSP
jgi:hypothetical protein